MAQNHRDNDRAGSDPTPAPVAPPARPAERQRWDDDGGNRDSYERGGPDQSTDQTGDKSNKSRADR